MFKIKCWPFILWCWIIDVVRTHSPSFGVNFCVNISLSLLTFPVPVNLYLFKELIVIPRDREMREPARKGPQDEEAICCSLPQCLVVLASPSVNTYLTINE